MKRRGFVKGLAATVAALEFIPEVAEGLTERLGTMARDLAGVADESTRWKRVRREFTLKPGLVHLNCGTIGASPGLVTAAVIAYLQELESDPLENMWGSSLGSQTEAVRAKAAIASSARGVSPRSRPMRRTCPSRFLPPFRTTPRASPTSSTG